MAIHLVVWDGGAQPVYHPSSWPARCLTAWGWAHSIAPSSPYCTAQCAALPTHHLSISPSLYIASTPKVWSDCQNNWMFLHLWFSKFFETPHIETPLKLLHATATCHSPQDHGSPDSNSMGMLPPEPEAQLAAWNLKGLGVRISLYFHLCLHFRIILHPREGQNRVVHL